MLKRLFYKKHILIFIITILSIVLTLLLGLIVLKTGVLPQIHLPRPSGITKESSSMPESEIESWTVYGNGRYEFTVEVPAKWNMQDYSAFHSNFGTVIAFSPKPLPCETCSYLNDGYFSIRIYNNQSDSGLYEIYAQKVKDVEEGIEYYRKIEMGGKPGISSDNSSIVENQGWVYELNLDKNNGTGKISESKILQRVFSSFKFTNIFN